MPVRCGDVWCAEDDIRPHPRAWPVNHEIEMFTDRYHQREPWEPSLRIAGEVEDRDQSSRETSGSRTVNVAPWPGAEATSMEPSCASTISFEM